MSLAFALLSASGCSEGINVKDQKQIDFSFEQEGSSDQWDVEDHISGTYYTIEKLIQSKHLVKLMPKENLELEKANVTVSFKVDGATIGLLKEGQKEQKVFKTRKTTDDSYLVDVSGFNRFDNNKQFGDEKLALVVHYGEKQDTIELH